MAPFDPSTLEVNPDDVRRLMDSGHEYQLVDCRRPDEVETASLSQACHIPMDDIPARQGEIEDDPDIPVIVMCHHGVRSLNVANFLRSQGLECVWSMRGGIDRWSKEIDSSVQQY